MAERLTASNDYLEFVKKRRVKNLTRNQWLFVEFLLENKRKVARIGSYEHLFRQVRSYLKSDFDWSKETSREEEIRVEEIERE
jgi:hypothetical protein